MVSAKYQPFTSGLNVAYLGPHEFSSFIFSLFSLLWSQCPIIHPEDVIKLPAGKLFECQVMIFGNLLKLLPMFHTYVWVKPH